MFQSLLEEGYRPTGVWVAEILGHPVQQGLQPVLIVFIQHRMAAPADVILKDGRITGLAVRPDPVVDALPRHAEHPRDVSRGPPMVKLQDGESAPIEEDIAGLLELTPETLPLPGGQVELAHELLHVHHSSP
jgi:hypothetical protein